MSRDQSASNSLTAILQSKQQMVADLKRAHAQLVDEQFALKSRLRDVAKETVVIEQRLQACRDAADLIESLMRLNKQNGNTSATSDDAGKTVVISQRALYRIREYWSVEEMEEAMSNELSNVQKERIEVFLSFSGTHCYPENSADEEDVTEASVLSELQADMDDWRITAVDCEPMRLHAKIDEIVEEYLIGELDNNIVCNDYGYMPDDDSNGRFAGEEVLWAFSRK
jgi:hypothetical protein